MRLALVLDVVHNIESGHGPQLQLTHPSDLADSGTPATSVTDAIPFTLRMVDEESKSCPLLPSDEVRVRRGKR
jgi:hypothetical protein